MNGVARLLLAAALLAVPCAPQAQEQEEAPPESSPRDQVSTTLEAGPHYHLWQFNCEKLGSISLRKVRLTVTHRGGSGPPSPRWTHYAQALVMAVAVMRRLPVPPLIGPAPPTASSHRGSSLRDLGGGWYALKFACEHNGAESPQARLSVGMLRSGHSVGETLLVTPWRDLAAEAVASTDP